MFGLVILVSGRIRQVQLEKGLAPLLIYLSIYLSIGFMMEPPVFAVICQNTISSASQNILIQFIGMKKITSPFCRGQRTTRVEIMSCSGAAHKKHSCNLALYLMPVPVSLIDITVRDRLPAI